MITLDFMIVADAANASEGKVNVIGGGITRLTPPTLPAMVNLAVALRLRVDSMAELEQVGPGDHRLDVVNPGGGVEISVPFGAGTKPDLASFEGEDIGALRIVQMSAFLLTQEGPYSFRLLTAADELLGERLVICAVQPG